MRAVAGVSHALDRLVLEAACYMQKKAVIPVSSVLEGEIGVRPSSEAVKLLTLEQAVKYRAMPIKIQSIRGVSSIAFITYDALRIAEIQNEIKFITGRDARGVIVSRELFDKSVSKAYVEGGGVLSRAVGQCADIKPLPSNNLSIVASTPALRVLDAIMQYALAKNASDVHLIPVNDGVRIELRINGEMFRSCELISNVTIYRELLNRLKILAGIDTTKPLAIAEGRFSMTISSKEIHARLSLIATAFGERATIRIATGGFKTLDQLGMPGEALRFLGMLEQQPVGGVLVSGATGSGKSSLLYGLIHRLLERGLSVSSVEDPVEIKLPGVSQTEVGKNGITYESGFSALLRHDPDVIMLGEIRSPESAVSAVHAMLSGHLVLSTIHAGGIYEMFLRLKGLGVSQVDLAESLRLLVNISLVPRLCSCKVVDLESSSSVGIKLFKKCGCHDCDYSGYVGRLPVLDLLLVDNDVKSALQELSVEALRGAVNNGNALFKSAQLESYLVAGEVSIRDCQGLLASI